MSKLTKSGEEGAKLVGKLVAWLIFYGFIGAFAVNYLLSVFLGKTMPYIGALLVGLFVGNYAVPAAIVVWLLKGFGVI